MTDCSTSSSCYTWTRSRECFPPSGSYCSPWILCSRVPASVLPELSLFRRFERYLRDYLLIDVGQAERFPTGPFLQVGLTRVEL
jgi:hypothetical protein